MAALYNIEAHIDRIGAVDNIEGDEFKFNFSTFEILTSLVIIGFF